MQRSGGCSEGCDTSKNRGPGVLQWSHDAAMMCAALALCALYGALVEILAVRPFASF
jgi:hypothetical protein